MRRVREAPGKGFPVAQAQAGTCLAGREKRAPNSRPLVSRLRSARTACVVSCLHGMRRACLHGVRSVSPSARARSAHSLSCNSRASEGSITGTPSRTG